MSEKQTKQDQKATSASTSNDALQDQFDQANEQGYFGAVTDPTPNENYTVKGVTSGKPTPETDADAAEKARKARNQ